MQVSGTQIPISELKALVVRSPFQGNVDGHASMFLQGEIIPAVGNVAELLGANLVAMATKAQTKGAVKCDEKRADGEKCGRSFVGDDFLEAHKLRQHQMAGTQASQGVATQPEPGPSDDEGSRDEALKAKGPIQHNASGE